MLAWRDDLRVQGRSEDQRDPLDVEAVAGHLLKPGSVFAYLAGRGGAMSSANRAVCSGVPDWDSPLSRLFDADINCPLLPRQPVRRLKLVWGEVDGEEAPRRLVAVGVPNLREPPQ